MDKIASDGVSVNYESRFSRVRDDVETLLARDPVGVIFSLLSCHISSIERPNGTLSIWGMTCPWCNGGGNKESSPLFLSSHGRKKLHCEKCGKSESIVFLFIEQHGLSLKSNIGLCSEKLANAAGVSSHDEYIKQRATGRFTDDFIIDMDDNPVQAQGRIFSPTGTMPQDKKNWIIRGIEFFLNRADLGELSKQESVAISYVMKRGISQNTIRSCKLFTSINSNKIMVVMPSYDCNKDLVGYQWFDYANVDKNGKAEYRACKNEFGSCRFPFGMEDCVGNNNPILMVCGFFDYLSAKEIGFDNVLSPFGTNMLSTDCSHIKDVVNGRSVSILFDRQIQELDQSLLVAESLRKVGAKVNILLWMKGKEGFDFNDFLLGCRKKNIENPREFIGSLIKDGMIRLIKHGKNIDIDQIIKDSGIEIGSYIMRGSWPASNIIVKNQEKQLSNIDISKNVHGRGKGASFEPDLEKAISGLSPMGEFHTLIMFTDIHSRFEMCTVLDVKRCALSDNCGCAVNNRLDISDGKYSSAFVNNTKMLPAIESINESFQFLCPNSKGWDKKEPKKILYKASTKSNTWSIIHARSLFSSSSKINMVTDISDIRTGIYEVYGYKSNHCGMTGSVFVIKEMKPYTIESVLQSMPHEESNSTEIDFFDGVSVILDSGMIGTPDMIFISTVCVWAFSPPVIPLIKDIGKDIINHRQPSLSIYAIGDPATGKTNTIREVSELAGHRCDPTDAKMATKPGLVISGADGSPGQMPRSIGRAMGLDEITDRKSVLEVIQLLVENRVSISMSGRNIDEVVPVRIALLSNANAERKKLHEFRTPMEAASDLIKEHLIRRIDMCVATISLSSEVDIDERNTNIYRKDININIDRNYLINLGKRCWRQNPKNIIVDDVAIEFLSDEKNIISKIDHIRTGNPMMYGDISQRIFRIACGIAGFSGSFSGENMIVKINHIMYAILLMNEMMDTMGASKEARFHMRTMDVEGAYKVLVDVCTEALSMMDSTQDSMMYAGKVIIAFIQTCNAHDPGSFVDTGIKELHRDLKDSKSEALSSERKLAPYKRAWKIIDRMKRNGLIKSEGHGSYSITETFARSVSIMETDAPVIYKKILE